MFTSTFSRVGGLKLGLLLTGILFLNFSSLLGQGPLLLDPLTQPKFKYPLPNPLDKSFIYQEDGTNLETVDGNPNVSVDYYNIGMYEASQFLGLEDANGAQLNTTIWGYGKSKITTTYPGRTFEVQKDKPIRVNWSNNLPNPITLQPGQMYHLLPVDKTLHWADPFNIHPHGGMGTSINPADPLTDHVSPPVVPHVHGGHTRSGSDGLPEYWWCHDQSGNTIKGRLYDHGDEKSYFYHNDQEAGTIWYHDHALGITRLNVYAGLAGFYIIRDNDDTGKPDNPLGLPANANDPNFPGAQYEIPIVIQDRMFDVNGQLHYPSSPAVIGAMFGYTPQVIGGLPNPTVGPEFMGDFILVNGVTWPYLDVEPRLYRFRVLNGSDSRFYNLKLPNNMRMYQIGTDDALLPAPVTLRELLIGPGERADILIDFTGKNGQTLIMTNDAKIPYPKGGPVDPQTTGQIMAFRVGNTVTSTANNVIQPFYRAAITSLPQTGPTRQLALYEGLDELGRLKPLLGTVVQGKLDWFAAISENPKLDSVEVWEVYNNTADAHPIHLHLVTFEILNRQGFKATVDPVTGKMTNIKLQGPAKLPELNERGWKDTGIMYPGEVTRVKAKFDRPGRYVWHCHILSHEDHEMMRPYHVGPIGFQREENPLETSLSLRAFPNPFEGRTTLRYNLPQAGQVSVKVFNTMGQEVATLMQGYQSEGLQELNWSAEGMTPGVYICRMTAGNEQAIVRLMVSK